MILSSESLKQICDYVGKKKYLQVLITKDFQKNYLDKYDKKTSLEILAISLKILKLNFTILSEKKVM